MTYGSEDGPDDIFVFVAKSEGDMVDHAMDAKQRALYESETGHRSGDANAEVHGVQALWWE